MKCPKCQTENPETRKFCKECGAKLIQGSRPFRRKFGAILPEIGAEFNLQEARELPKIGAT